MLKFILTCEHGGNQVPMAYADLFKDKQQLLASHQGYDLGALELFRDLEPLADATYYSETTRLLVELNRSLHHKNLFSKVTKPLSEKEHEQIIKQHYFPYRNKVEQLVQDFVFADRQILHISVHSFTPELKGEVRTADIGLLYDPKRKQETAFCKAWKQAIQQQNPALGVRYNYPYLGISDGFPTYLRKKYEDEEYMGIELEVNQKFFMAENEDWPQLKQSIKNALEATLIQFRGEARTEEVA